MRTIHIFSVLFFLGLLFVSSGCEQLTNGLQEAEMPSMAHNETTLLRAPTTSQLLDFYCPGVAGNTACSIAGFNAAPAKSDLRFDFELSFNIDNPNTVPIPALSMLLATTLFPGVADTQELGAVCVTFCDPTADSCGGVSAEDACAAGDQRDIESFDDFIGQARDNLVALAIGDGFDGNDSIKTIPANGSGEMKVIFTLGLDPMTEVMEKVAGQYVNDFLSGATNTKVEVPYDVQGTVWMDLPFGFGRFGLPFAPETQVWTLN